MRYSRRRLKTPWAGSWIKIPKDLTQEQLSSWNSTYGSTKFSSEPLQNLGLEGSEYLAIHEQIPVTHLVDQLMLPPTASAQGGGTSTRAADHKVAELLGGSLGSKQAMSSKTFEARRKKLEDTFKLRVSAKDKLREQASVIAKVAGEKRGSIEAMKIHGDHMHCYLSKREQSTLYMPLLKSDPLLDDSMLEGLAREKLKAQAILAAQHRKQKKQKGQTGQEEQEEVASQDEEDGQDEEGGQDEQDEQGKQKRHKRKHWELSIEEQDAMFLERLETVSVIPFPGGPDMIADVLVGAQKACRDLSAMTISKGDIFSALRQQAIVNEIQSTFGSNGELQVELAYGPFRSLLQSVAAKLPVRYRSYMCTPMDMVGHDHQIDHYFCKIAAPGYKTRPNAASVPVKVIAAQDLKTPLVMKLISLENFLEGLMDELLQGRKQKLRMAYDGSRWEIVWEYPGVRGCTDAIGHKIFQLVQGMLQGGCVQGSLSTLEHFIFSKMQLDPRATDVGLAISPALDCSNEILSFAKYDFAMMLSQPEDTSGREHFRTKPTSIKLKKDFHQETLEHVDEDGTQVVVNTTAAEVSGASVS